MSDKIEVTFQIIEEQKEEISALKEKLEEVEASLCKSRYAHDEEVIRASRNEDNLKAKLAEKDERIEELEKALIMIQSVCY